MSPVYEKPILHGRDHCPGGADPIPCMIGGPGASGDYEGTVLGLGPYAYWRLGETGEPWADTSGFGTADDLSEYDSGTAPTPDVTGALAVGDDGAVEFNYDGSSAGGGRYLGSTGSNKDFTFVGSSGEMTVAVWAKIKSSALTRHGIIIGNSAISGGNTHGWALQVFYPTRGIRFGRFNGASGELYAEVGGSPANTWYFFVGTYDGADIKLYIDAELQDTTADPSGTALGLDEQIKVGYGDSVGYTHSWHYGMADEAAVWTRALTVDEIEEIYAVGIGGGGDAAGYVLTSDGAGGTSWAAPTVEVTF